ncbi:MAG: hypothetical protein J6Z34_05700 [Clostridia bacterium]|nr:hypothetical protein [Clostridia bacterium]
MDNLKNLNVHKIIDFVAEEVNTFNAVKAELVNDIADLAKDFVTADATIANFKVNKELDVRTVTEDVYDVIKTATGKKLAPSLERIITEFEEVYGDVKLFDNFLGGMKDATLNMVVADEVSEIASGFNMPKVIEELVEQFADLYDGVKLKDFVSASKELRVYGVIEAVGEVVKAIPVNEDIVNGVVEIAELILADTDVMHVALNEFTTVEDLYDSAYATFKKVSGKKFGAKVEEVIDFVLDRYGKVVIKDFVNSAVQATKEIEIAPTVKDLLGLFGITREFKLYELFEDEEGYITVDDFMTNPSEAVNRITAHIKSIDDVNAIMADLYYNKDFADTNWWQKGLIYGTYGAAAVIAYFVAHDQIYNAMEGKLLSDYVNAGGIAGSNEDLKALLDKVLDTKITDLFDVIDGNKTIEEGIDAIVKDIRVGDIVAAFTMLTDDGANWTYGKEEIGRMLGDAFDVQIADLAEVAFGKKKIKDVYDYTAITVDDIGGFAFDVAGILDVHFNYMSDELQDKTEALGNLTADTFLNRNDLVSKAKLKDISVDTIVRYTDNVFGIFKPEVVTNKVYKAITEVISDLIGEAVLVEGDPFKFTPETVVEAIKNTEIREELVPAIEKVVTGFTKYGKNVGNALEVITEVVFAEHSTVSDATFNDVTVNDVLYVVEKGLPNKVLNNKYFKGVDEFVGNVIGSAKFVEGGKKPAFAPNNIINTLLDERIAYILDEAKKMLDTFGLLKDTKLGNTLRNAFDNAGGLYGDSTARELRSATMSIMMHALVDAVLDTFSVDSSESNGGASHIASVNIAGSGNAVLKREVAEAAKRLIKTLLTDRKIGEARINGNAKVADVTEDVISVIEASIDMKFNRESIAGILVNFAEETFKDVTIGNLAQFAKDAQNISVKGEDGLVGLFDKVGAKISSFKPELRVAIVNALNDIFADDAKVSKPGFNASVYVGTLVKDVYEIVKAATGKYADEKTADTVQAIVDLFDDVPVKLSSVATDVQKLKVYKTVETVADIVNINSANETVKKVVPHAVTLVELLLEDTAITAFKVNTGVTVDETYNAVYDVIKAATGKEIKDGSAIDVIIDYALDHFGSIALKDIAKDAPETAKNLEVKGAGSVLELVDNVLATTTVKPAVKDAIVALAEDVLKDSKVSAIGVDNEAVVGDVVTHAYDLVKAAANYNNANTDVAVEKAVTLLNSAPVRLGHMANDFKAIDTYTAIDTVSEIVVAVSANAKVDEVTPKAAELVKVLVKDGTIGATGINTEATIEEVYESAYEVVKAASGQQIKDGSAIDVIIDYALDHFGSIALKDIAKDAPETAKNLEVKGAGSVLELVDNVLATTTVKPAVKDAIVALAEDLLDDTTVSAIGINNSANLGDVVNDGYGVVKAVTGKENEKVTNVIAAVTGLVNTVPVTLGNIVGELRSIRVYDAADAVAEIVAAITDNQTANRIASSAVRQTKNFVDEESTFTRATIKNLSLSTVNDALADVLFDSTMETLLNGSNADKAKAYVIYYIDANVAAIAYMVARQKVSDFLGDRTIEKVISVGGKTPEISNALANVVINDILRVSVDTLTGNYDNNGGLTVPEFIDMYFADSTLGDVINVFLPEKVAGNNVVKHIGEVKLIDVYEAITGKVDRWQFVRNVLDGLTVGDTYNNKVISVKGNVLEIVYYIASIELNDVVGMILPRFITTAAYPKVSADYIVDNYFTAAGTSPLVTVMGDAKVEHAVSPFLSSSLRNNFIVSKFMPITVKDVYEVVRGRAGINALLYKALENVHVAEVLGYTAGEDGKWLDKKGNARFEYTANPSQLTLIDGYLVKPFVKDLISISIGKFFKPTSGDSYLTQVRNGIVKIGDIFDMTYSESEQTWYRGSDVTDTPSTLWNAVFSKTVTDFTSGDVKNTVINTFGNIRFGELLYDLTYNDTTDTWIYNPSNGITFEDGKLISRIEKNVFRLRLNDIYVDGNINTTNVMNSVLEDIYVGDALGYKTLTVTEFDKTAATEEKTLLDVIATYGKETDGFGKTYKISDAANLYYVLESSSNYYFVSEEKGTYKKMTVSVPAVRRLDYDDFAFTEAESESTGKDLFTVSQLGYVWVDENGVNAKTIYNVLSNTKLSDMVNPPEGSTGNIPLLDELGWLAISDLPFNLGGNAIIDRISDYPLCKIGEEINNLYIGDVMDYYIGDAVDTSAMDTVVEKDGVAVVKSVTVLGTTTYYKLKGKEYYEAELTSSATRKMNYPAAYERKYGAGATFDRYSSADNFDFVWKKETSPNVYEEVDALTAMMASIKIKDMSAGFNLNDKIDWFSINDMFTDDSSIKNNALFKGIVDAPLCDISNAANSLYLYTVLGYDRVGEVTEYAGKAYDEIAGYTPAVAGDHTVLTDGHGNYIKRAVKYEDESTLWFVADGTIADRKAQTDRKAADYSFNYTEKKEVAGIETDVAVTDHLKVLVADMTLDEFSKGGFDAIMNNINYLTLEEVLGGDNGLFGNNIFNSLKDKPIGTLGTAINDMRLGEFMNYSLVEHTTTGYSDIAVTGIMKHDVNDEYLREVDGKWYKVTAEVADRKAAYSEPVTAADYTFVWQQSSVDVSSIVNRVIASFKVSDISSGADTMIDQILWLSAPELLGTAATDSAIFRAIGDAPMKKINEAINDVYVGELMDYELQEIPATAFIGYTGTVVSGKVLKNPATEEYAKEKDGKWYKAKDMYAGSDTTHSYVAEDFDFVWKKKATAGGAEVTGVEGIMANIQIGSLNTANFSDKVKALKVNEVMTVESGSLMDILVGDSTIGNMGTTVEDNMKTISVGTLITKGILTGMDEDKIGMLMVHNGYRGYRTDAVDTTSEYYALGLTDSNLYQGSVTIYLSYDPGTDTYNTATAISATEVQGDDYIDWHDMSLSQFMAAIIG